MNELSCGNEFFFFVQGSVVYSMKYMYGCTGCFSLTYEPVISLKLSQSFGKFCLFLITSQTLSATPHVPVKDALLCNNERPKVIVKFK